MQIGLGVLELSPDDFWSMTFQEFTAAFDGWQEKNGAKPEQPPLEADDFRTLAETEMRPERLSKEAREMFRGR